MRSLKEVDVDRVEAPGANQAVRVIKDVLLAEPFVNSGFRFMEIAFTAAGTFKVAHGLGFMPLDVVQSSLKGTGAVTWNYASFDKTNLSVTTTAACTVRAFIGAYRGT
jgi:hypothetical protein